MLVVAGGDAAVLLQPVDAALDHVAPAISVAVECRRTPAPRPLAARCARWSRRSRMVCGMPRRNATAGSAGSALVAEQPGGALARPPAAARDPDRVEHRLQLGAVVGRPPSASQLRWTPSSSGRRGCARALGPPGAAPPFRPWPARAGRRRRAGGRAPRCYRRCTPTRCRRRRPPRPAAPAGGGPRCRRAPSARSGRSATARRAAISRQPAPFRSTQRMPLMILRWGAPGAPAPGSCAAAAAPTAATPTPSDRARHRSPPAVRRLLPRRENASIARHALVG